MTAILCVEQRISFISDDIFTLKSHSTWNSTSLNEIFVIISINTNNYCSITWCKGWMPSLGPLTSCPMLEHNEERWWSAGRNGFRRFPPSVPWCMSSEFWHLIRAEGCPLLPWTHQAMFPSKGKRIVRFPKLLYNLPALVLFLWLHPLLNDHQFQLWNRKLQPLWKWHVTNLST